MKFACARQLSAAPTTEESASAPPQAPVDLRLQVLILLPLAAKLGEWPARLLDAMGMESAFTLSVAGMQNVARGERNESSMNIEMYQIDEQSSTSKE